jgi:hypothetical protein
VSFPRGRLQRITGTSAGLTIATTAYTSGDVLGSEIVLPVGASAEGLKTGWIHGGTVIDKGDVLTDVDVFLFDRASTPAANNAAAAWADADIANLLWFEQLTVDLDFGGNRGLKWLPSSPVPFVAPAGSLYATLVTRSANAVFTAVTDVSINLIVELQQ